METSFLIPSFNHERYISKCLQSVLENRVQGMELIICDDGSKDNSLNLIENWAEEHSKLFERFTLIKHSRNYGLSSTLNEMISVARGEVITGVASDDYVLPGGIHYKILAMKENPNWLGAFTDGIAVGLDDEIYSGSLLLASGLTAAMLSRARIKNTVLGKWIEPMNLQFWRRTAFVAHGGEFQFQTGLHCEDLNFALWALAKDGFGFLNQKCVGYRCRSWPQTPYVKNNAEISRLHADLSKSYRAHSILYQKTSKKYLEDKSDYYLHLSNAHYSQALKYRRKLGNGPIRGVNAAFFSLIAPILLYQLGTFFQLFKILYASRSHRKRIALLRLNQTVDPDFYRNQRPRNLAAQFHPVGHYVVFGEAEGLLPNPTLLPNKRILYAEAWTKQ